MSDTTPFDSEQWLAELERVGILGSKDDDGYSTQEFADAIGVTIVSARKILKLGMSKGLVKVGSRTITALNNRLMRVPIYIIPKPNKKSSRAKSAHKRRP